MKRDIHKLAETTYDLLIIGGGINGACSAWDATLRGLSVALVDKGDFGAATSANSLKIIHGGLRYLQHADFNRMRESIRERSTLMRIAPHLVYPLSFIVPTYNHFKQSKQLLQLALKINDLIGFERKSLNEPSLVIPPGKVVTREDCLKIYPGFNKHGLTGGAIWYDCQVYNSERLTLAFLRSAAESGAVIANYTEVRGALTKSRRICFVRAVDLLNGDEIELRARVVLNNSGPWVDDVIGRLNDANRFFPSRQNSALGLNLVSPKIISDTAIGFKSKTTREQDPICGGNRFIFLVPWRGYTLIGTSYKHFSGHPDDCITRKKDIQNLLDECNIACPSLQLRFEDISFYHQGLLPLVNNSRGFRNVTLAEKHRIIDHASEDNLYGLISVIGVKYTVARALAQKVVDLIFKKIGYNSPPRCMTSQIPIYGGDYDISVNFLDAANKDIPQHIPKEARDRLKRNYGSRTQEVVAYAKHEPEWGLPLTDDSPLLRCEVLHAIRAEMAVKLADVIFRRTEMGTAACQPRSHVEAVAQIMAEELGWNQKRRENEIDEVLVSYSPLNIKQ